jgi:putative oxidoreductase
MAKSALVRFDRTVIEFTRAHSIPILRMSLGIVFVWFGVLKIVGHSPVADLVIKTAYFLPPNVAVIGMGVLETVIGIGLITGVAMRLTLLMFFVQMCGTFLTIVTRPDLLIEHGDPLLLSVNGEFLLKNLVLIAAGIVIVGSVPKARDEKPRGRGGRP